MTSTPTHGTARRRLLPGLVLFLILAPAAAALGLAGVAHLASTEGFCTSCQLPSGRPLHELKAQLARPPPPRDMTAVHLQQHRAPMDCVGCHRGTGWRGRGVVLWGSLRNTLRYVFAGYREPESLGHPTEDAACVGCHGVAELASSAQRFHGLRARQGLSALVTCTDCHLSHAQSPQGAGHAERLALAALAGCRRCHESDDQAPPVQALLDDYAKAPPRWCHRGSMGLLGALRTAPRCPDPRRTGASCARRRCPSCASRCAR